MNAIHHYHRLRDLFAKRDFGALLQDPFSSSHPLNQALRFWAAFLEQKSCPPPSLEIVHQPLSVQCQQALLWAALAQETGESRFQEAANALGGILAPVVEHGFMTAWAREGEYEKEETLWAAELFRRALRGEVSEGIFPNVQINPVEPAVRPYTIFEQNNDAMIYFLDSTRAALGAARVGSVQILTFGLQTAPQSFGADITSNNHVRSSSLPNVWLHLDRGPFAFSLQATGLTPNTPLYLAFYIDAKNCLVDGKNFKPRSLNKFQGAAEKFQFDEMQLRVTPSVSSELIPLAGGNSYWGASFLLTLRLPLSGKLNLQIAK